MPLLLPLLRVHMGPAVARQWGPIRQGREQGYMGPAPHTGLLEMLPSRWETLAGWLSYLPAKCKGSHPTLKQARLQISRQSLHPAGRAWPLPSTATGGDAQPTHQACSSTWTRTLLLIHMQGSLVTCLPAHLAVS